MRIRKTAALLILGGLFFNSSAIVAQTTQVVAETAPPSTTESTKAAPAFIGTEPSGESPVQILVPELPAKSVPAEEEIPVSPTVPASAKLKVVTEVEIRPVDGVMRIKTEDDPMPREMSLEKLMVEELVRITPGSALPTSKAIAIKQTPEGALEIKVEEVSASTALPVKVIEGKIEVEVKDDWETVILPSEVEILVKDVSPSPTEVKKMELVECKPTLGPEQDCQAVYKTEVERKTNFLGIVEVRPTLKYEVNAASGQILSEEKPWYLKLLPFLFK